MNYAVLNTQVLRINLLFRTLRQKGGSEARLASVVSGGFHFAKISFEFTRENTQTILRLKLELKEEFGTSRKTAAPNFRPCTIKPVYFGAH